MVIYIQVISLLQLLEPTEGVEPSPIRVEIRPLSPELRGCAFAFFNEQDLARRHPHDATGLANDGAVGVEPESVLDLLESPLLREGGVHTRRCAVEHVDNRPVTQRRHFLALQ